MPESSSSQKARPSLTEGPITKTLILFSLPILLGNVLQSLNGSINTIWIGKYLGEVALAATSNANIIMFFLISSIFGIAMAAVILIGQNLGAKKVHEAKQVVGTSTVFFLRIIDRRRYIGLVLLLNHIGLDEYPGRCKRVCRYLYAYYVRRCSVHVWL